jgi:DNA-binding transcriptional LysR family regulator
MPAIDIIDDVDVRQLEAFLHVTRVGRLGQAASELYITQPALTARIQRLERELGGELFVRSKRGMRLSPAGRAFVPFAVRAIESIEEGRSLVAGIAATRERVLALAAPPAVGTHVLPQLLQRFAAGHPDVKLAVRSGHSEEILELVLREEVDLGLVRSIPHPDTTETTVYEDEMVLVAPKGHRLAGVGSATVAELGRERLIVFDPSSSYHQLTHTLLQSARVRPQTTLEVDNSEAAAKMVEHGLGVALLPHSAASDGLASGRLVEVRLFGVRLPRRAIVAIRRRDAEKNEAADDFLRLLLDEPQAFGRG